jgi:LPXTG-motif cell wall-anchored protein
MRKRNLAGIASAGLLLLAVASFSLAQNADQNTAGPTRNTLKLKVTEPAEGAQITGSTVRVAVDFNRTVFGAGQGTKFGENNFPMPLFDVYVDDSLKQTLKGGETNVAVIPNVPAGAHKIVVVAKNISGEVIDRAVIHVTNTESAVASTSTDNTPPPAPSTDTASPPVQPMASAPAPAPAYSAPAPVATADSDTLPKTSSDAPATALLGLSLVASGLLLAVARRAR